MPVRGNERSHVLRGLGKGKLETGNRSEDLGETDENVGHGLHPDVDWGGVVARVHLVAAGARRVDVVLDHGSGDHGERGEDETKGNALDGCEADVCLAEGRVQEVDNFWEDVKPSHLGSSKPSWMQFDDAWVDQVARGLRACSCFTWIPLYCKFFSSSRSVEISRN